MDDFDYSVEISDRDWQCFFMECEECNLFPPSLAGVDDSGMSDLDDTASMLAKRVQNHDLTAGLSEAARPVDSSPDSKSPPLEQYLMKQGGSGMESVLSGSEEDIHLQSVNMFFERLRNLPEAERPAERSHVSAGENREAKKEELQRSDGRQASSSTLPENVPKLNSSPARDGAAVDKETMKPVDAISNGNTMKRVKPGVCISLEPAASGSAMKKNRLAYPEFFIREETKAKPQCHDSPTAEMTSYTDKVNVCTTLDGVRQQGLSTGLFSNHEMFTAPDVLQPDATIQNGTATQQPSPSASVKRKRRKKRRLSIEPVESGLVCERQVLGARTDDSEEEQRPWRGAAGCSLSELDTSSLCPVTSNAPATISTEEVEVKYRSDKVEELSGLNKYCWLPRSVAASGAGKSDALEGTGNGEGIDAHAESLQQQNKVNHVNIYCESCSTAEVKSITHSILQRAGLNNPDVEVSQNDNVSVAKSVLAGEGGYSSRYKHTLCQREAEQQQQLEIDTDQYSSTLGKTGVRPPGVCETGRTKSDAHNIKLQQFKTSPSPFPDDIFCKVSDAKLADDWTNSSSDQSCLSVKQTECPLETRSLSKSNFLTEKASGTDADRTEPPQITSLCSQREPKLLTSPSDITPLSPCSTLDTVVSVSNENITDLSASFCSSISQNESEGERQSPTLEKDATGPKSQTVLDSAESNSDVAMGAGDAVTPLEAGHKPKSKLSVFTMSSFWGEMEKLTINDILGLRMANNAAPHSSLPPLQEDEEMDMFTTDYSGVFTQLEDSVPDPESLASVMALDSSSSRSVTWEGEAVPVTVAADLYPGNMMLTSAISPPVVSGSAQTCLRKISKNASVHNLHALVSEPFSSTLKQQTLPSSNEGGLEKVQCVAEETGPGKDDGSSSSSLRGSYRTSIMDVFRYYFGGKEPVPSQSATDNLTTLYADGNTLPETYDHFFSDFDTESFFCPLITAADAKDELVPIFSYSRSANRNLQFPEAYDYFFASSSSDDSSVESDDEENSGPVRVVSRFTQKTSTSPMSVDAYEHFCTDRDLGQNLFWKDTLSFRNFYLTGSTSQKPSLSSSVSLVPTRQNTTSPQRTVCPSNVLGNQDAVFPDPLLCHLEDRISKQLRQRPFRYDDLQTAVSNPRLDASFLPLRQSDMCLVCIAFASWVLKTANPQVGDAWKAVVLANVSALSAIRYLRKYVKVEAAASEKKLNTDIS